MVHYNTTIYKLQKLVREILTQYLFEANLASHGLFLRLVLLVRILKLEPVEVNTEEDPTQTHLSVRNFVYM